MTCSRADSEVPGVIYVRVRLFRVRGLMAGITWCLLHSAVHQLRFVQINGGLQFNNRLFCCVVAVVIGDYREDSLENVLISSVLDKHCEVCAFVCVE